MLAGVAVLAAIGAWRGGLPRLRSRPRAWFVLGTVNVAIPFALICAAQLTIPASLATIVNATTPLWAVLGLAVGSTAIAYQLYFRLIEEVGVNSTLSVTYLVPVFGVLWAALFRDEQITGGMVAGTALVLAGVALVTRGARAGRMGVPALAGAGGAGDVRTRR